MAIPIAIEAIVFVGRLIKNQEAISQNLLKAKGWFLDTFTSRPTETLEQSQKRILKNFLVALIVVSALCAGSIAPFFILPPLFALPIAVLTITSIGKLIANREAIANKAFEAKEFVWDCFTQRAGESKEESNQRITTNALKAALIGMLIIGASASLAYLIQAGIMASALSSLLGWFNSTALGAQISGYIEGFSKGSLYNDPPVTSLLIFCEYAFISFLHILQAIRNYDSGNKGRSFYHLINALISMTCPLFMLFNNERLRLHHSFYGLVLQLTPFRALNFLGGMITLDSMLYWAFPNRSNYDYSNILTDHSSAFLWMLTALTSFQVLHEQLIPLKKKTPAVPVELSP